MRAEAQEKRIPFRVRSPWRERSDGDPAAPHVIRLRAPQEGATTIDDRVQGEVTVQNAELDDFILLRSDGTPTSMLSVVVDDRSEEHTSELQSLMRISYAVFCLKKQNIPHKHAITRYYIC